MKCCIVTEEFVGLPGSGGIGTAFTELAHLLAANGAEVEVLVCRSGEMPPEAVTQVARRARQAGIQLQVLDLHAHAWGPHDAAKRSFCVWQYLKHRDFDIVHFADYLGNGYYSMLAKEQGLAFGQTLLVTQVHGPSRWARLENARTCQSHEDLRIDFMEREQVRLSDQVIAPSRYILERIAALGFTWAQEPRVMKNVFSRLSDPSRCNRLATARAPAAVSELVFFGRHEDRKGIALFCDVVDRLAPQLKEHRIGVTFLGGFGEVRGKPSGVFLLERARSWELELRILPQYDRDQATAYLARNPGALMLMPSVENSPYTVLEALAAGRCFVTCSEGGAAELIARKDRRAFTAEKTAAAFAAKALHFIETGVRPAALDQDSTAVAREWLDFHAQLPALAGSPQRRGRRRGGGPSALPKVVLGITHYERPAKLLDALWSAVRQTYPNLEIVVVDDGSTSEEAIAGLKMVECILQRAGGRLIRQPNRYLGAARNAIARATESDYLVFLDDDNLARPELVATLVDAAQASGADVLTCMSHFVEEHERTRATCGLDGFRTPLSYCPTAGPLALAPFENCYGDATALIRRKTFDEIGGYTELRDVGYEDYEFFLRCAQAGKRVSVCPEQLYLYEVGKVSMLSDGSPWLNQQRVLGALDPSRLDAETIRAVVELNAGRTVAEHERGRNRWLFERTYGAHVFDELLDANRSTADKLSRLVALAEQAQAPRCAEAFRQAARPVEETDWEPVAPVPVARPRLVPLSLAASRRGGAARKASLNAYSLFIEGKAEAAANAVLAQLSSQGTLDPELGILLVRILRYSGFKPSKAFVARVFASVNGATVDSTTGALLWSGLALCCIKTGNRPALGLLWNHVVAEESMRYAQDHPDVQEALAAGTYPSALQHFCTHGRSERRAGFPVATSLAAEVAAFFGCEATLPAICEATRQDTTLVAA